jgi:hypothetical protein
MSERVIPRLANDIQRCDGMLTMLPGEHPVICPNRHDCLRHMTEVSKTERQTFVIAEADSEGKCPHLWRF